MLFNIRNMQTIKPSVLAILILTCFSMVTVQSVFAEQVNCDLHDGLQMVSDLAAPGYFTVFHNGVLVQNHVEVREPTASPNPEFRPHD
jgi:hypothetical protein